MQLKYRVYNWLLDLIKVGPIFFYHGLMSNGRSKSMKRIDIAGVGGINFRSGDSDFETIRQVFRNQELSLVIREVSNRVYDRYSEILAAGRRPVIIDAGANIGTASLWFQQHYPDAVVVAIEPDPANVELLRKNVLGRNIVVLDAAIGSEEGFVSLDNQGASWAVQTVRADSGLEVVTVDRAIQSVSDGELFIVKVDIEGFERDLFASNTRWIDQAYVIYVEPHDWLFPGKRTSRTFQQEISKRDFELFINRENLIYVR